jgi:hypothetical protein
MKSKAPLIVLALAALAIMACAAGDDPYESFTLLMDRVSGPGQWSDQGHKWSSGGLTVNGLTLKIDREVGTDGPPVTMTVDSVFIKKLAPKSQMEKLLSLADWQGQPATVLAGAVRLKDFQGREAGPGGEIETRIEELNLGEAKLAPSAPEAPAGADGFLKALRLGSLGYKNFRLTFKGPEAEASAAVESATLESLSFGAVGTLKMTDLKSGFTGGEGRNYSLNLAGLSLRGLDAADYLGKLLAGLALIKDNPDEAETIIAGQFTLADLLVSPVSLEEAVLTGLDLDLGPASVKVAEIKATGPYRTGEIPASAKSRVKGLEINLSGDPEAREGTPDRDIHEFSRLLGRNAFALEAESESIYETRTGRLTTRLNHLAARDLFGLSFSQTWDGLTGDRLEKFKKIPLAALYLAALDPGDLLGDASFNALNIKYTDQGLVDLIFDFQARKAGVETGAELKQRTTAEMGLMLTIMGSRYLKNIEDLNRPLLDFLKSPQSLEIDLKAAPPLTFATIQGLGDDPAALLDALNITFSANGQTGSPLLFVPGLGSDPGPGMDDDEEGQD